ncbi:MAG: DUF2809 domain-containing protein [Deltaproteobacteria bacterium]|nr:DUF2809 domain-containing protein [Deltaproteobacteria bacterium]
MDRPLNTARIRIFAGIAAVLTIAAGLAVRQWVPSGFWSKYSGVALWSGVVYALVVFVRPIAGVIRCAVIALLISWAVEFAQLTPAPGWLSSRHSGLRMIFGEHFSVRDLPAYAVGVLLAAITDVSIVSRRAPVALRRTLRRGSSTP